MHDEQTDFISKRHAILRRLALGYIWRKIYVAQANANNIIEYGPKVIDAYPTQKAYCENIVGQALLLATAITHLWEGQTLEESELKEALRRATGTLRRSEKRLWRMFAEAQMDTREIAIATGINARTVSAMLSHARHIIYNMLKKGGYIDE